MRAKTRQVTRSATDLGQLANCLVTASRWMFWKSRPERMSFFQALGRVLGAHLAAISDSSKVEERIRDVPTVCRNLELGNIRIEWWEPLLFIVYPGNSQHARGGQNGEVFAAFREGVLDAFVSEGLDPDPFVKHTFAIGSLERKSKP